MLRSGLPVLAIVGGLGAAHAQEGLAGYRAYEIYEACMNGHIPAYAMRQAKPEKIAAKIARLCRAEEEAMLEAHIGDFRATGVNAKSAAEQAGLIVQQVIAGMGEATRARIVLFRLDAADRE
jgi:hypothetical protein